MHAVIDMSAGVLFLQGFLQKHPEADKDEYTPVRGIPYFEASQESKGGDIDNYTSMKYTLTVRDYRGIYRSIVLC